MSKQAEAELILKLFELRREPVMRQARDWFAIQFDPETAADVKNVILGEHSGHLRMLISYWEMAAALVHHDAITLELFNDTNGEYMMVFAKLEPLLGELREMFGPQLLTNLEKLVDATPNGRERSAMVRGRMKAMRAEVLAAQQQKTASASQS